MCQVVQLNVGGTVFQAYQTTLQRSVHLKTLLSSELEDDSVDTDGTLFIDRDPDLFKQVLKLLRGYRFRSQPGLSWEEVKQEADFYQVPELETVAPEIPVIVVVPEEAVVIRQVTLVEFVTKRGRVYYTVSDSDWRQLPDDLANKVHSLSAHGPTCLDINHVIAAGYERKNLEDGGEDDTDDTKEKLIYECQEKVVYYAKTAGTSLQVAELHNEVLREDCPHWIRIICRFKIGE